MVDTTAAEPEYEVETFLHSHKHQHNKCQWVEYLVKWKDYPIHEATWEPADHLANAKDAIRTFLSRTTSNQDGE